MYLIAIEIIDNAQYEKHNVQKQQIFFSYFAFSLLKIDI